MADEPTAAGGWLPPAAPGGRPAPQFEPAPPEPEPEAEPPSDVAAAWGTPAHRAVFTPARSTPSPPNGLATTSLVLGIVGLLLVIFAPLSLPVSIAAWITGAQSRKRIAAGLTDQGEGSARGGVILGIVGVVLGMLVVTAWIVLVALGVDLEELRRDLERRSSS